MCEGNSEERDLAGSCPQKAVLTQVDVLDGCWRSEAAAIMGSAVIFQEEEILLLFYQHCFLPATIDVGTWSGLNKILLYK